MNPRQAIFTLSLDLELLWGTVDLHGPDGFRRRCTIEREIVIDRMLGLLAQFEIPATWCVVGHLFLDRCERQNGDKHPEIVQPHHPWRRGDWFEHDPDGTESEAPLFLGRSLIEKIRECPVPQEIGSHSFSHVIFGDRGCSRETAGSELKACVRAAEQMGLRLRSFSFPRNRVGHLDLLTNHGFICYRGPEPRWYQSSRLPEIIRRIGHLWDVLVVKEPPVVEPRAVSDGIVEVPGSYVLLPIHGWRRLIPVSWRVRRALKGLDAAVREGRVFHLWAHPTSFADESERMFMGLRQILERACQLRDGRLLTILPMGAVAARAESPVAQSRG
jgi:peptidoglycan/xylan/chitin deacetylase (PgdA/CDA1 family)